MQNVISFINGVIPLVNLGVILILVGIDNVEDYLYISTSFGTISLFLS